MQFNFTKHGSFRAQNAPIARQSRLAVEMTDLGFDDGIDVVIFEETTGRVLFETVLVDAGSQVLLTFGNPQAEAFWDCLDTNECLHTAQRLCLAARCHFSLLTPAISLSGMGQAERRNACFMRLVEALIDEFRTRAPNVQVDVTLTHRNRAFESCINYP